MMRRPQVDIAKFVRFSIAQLPYLANETTRCIKTK